MNELAKNGGAVPLKPTAFGNTLLAISPAVLLTLAAVFNLNIWTFHFIKIGEAAQ